MRSLTIAAGALLVLLTSACGGGSSGGLGPTQGDIEANLEAQLKSVAGEWTGVAPSPGTLSLAFQLQEGSNGQVTGTGTMRENASAASVPITITGTWQRPVLTLTFNGMIVDAKTVTATTQGNYTTVGGIAATLNLVAPGYTRQIPMLLQEK